MSEYKTSQLDAVIMIVFEELRRAQGLYDPFPTPEHGYAVILEEVEELWQEIKKKPKDRDMAAMEEEAKQIAAMGIRFLLDVCGKSHD